MSDKVPLRQLVRVHLPDGTEVVVPYVALKLSGDAAVSLPVHGPRTLDQQVEYERRQRNSFQLLRDTIDLIHRGLDP